MVTACVQTALPLHLVDEGRALKGFDMRSRGSNGHPYRRPIRSDIFQICIGLVLAAFLFQADRTISALGPEGALSQTIFNRHTLAVGAHMVRLEVDHLVNVLRHATNTTGAGRE